MMLYKGKLEFSTDIAVKELIKFGSCIKVIKNNEPTTDYHDGKRANYFYANLKKSAKKDVYINVFFKRRAK